MFINLEFMLETLNQKKGSKVGDRQVRMARMWHKAGVLTASDNRAHPRSFVRSLRSARFWSGPIPSGPALLR